MVFTAAGIGANLVHLQSAALVQPSAQAWVLVPIGAGLTLMLTGVAEHLRAQGRTFIFVTRLWQGAALYLCLSIGLAVL